MQQRLSRSNSFSNSLSRCSLKVLGSMVRATHIGLRTLKWGTLLNKEGNNGSWKGCPHGQHAAEGPAVAGVIRRWDKQEVTYIMASICFIKYNVVFLLLYKPIFDCYTILRKLLNSNWFTKVTKYHKNVQSALFIVTSLPDHAVFGATVSIETTVTLQVFTITLSLNCK